MASYEERLLKYNELRFFDHGRFNGNSPKAALLGKGASGYVYSLKRSDGDAHPLAVKIIPIPRDDDSKFNNLTEEKRRLRIEREISNVREEIKIMKKLEGDSHICYFSDSRIVQRSDPYGYDAMIFMDQLISLRDYLRANATGISNRDYGIIVLNIWKDISAALSVCESNSILHLDVKPDNIFYASNSGYFKLSDFGVAMNSQTVRPGVYVGTPDYMAPELQKKAGGNAKVDIYSLGVTIYQLFNDNRLPFEGEGTDRKTAIEMRSSGKFSIPEIPGIPKEVNAVLLKCLSQNAEDRPASNRDVFEEVTELYLKYKRNGGTWGSKSKGFQKGSIRWIIIGSIAAGVIIIAALLIARGGSNKNTLPVQNEQAAVLTTDSPEKMPEISNLVVNQNYILPRSGEDAAISGSFITDQNIEQPKHLYIGDSEIENVEWTRTDTGYTFTAAFSADRYSGDQLEVRIDVDGAEGALHASVPMAKLTLHAEESDFQRNADGASITGHIGANIPLDTIELYADGVKLENADIREAESGWDFSASLQENQLDNAKLHIQAKGTLNDAPVESNALALTVPVSQTAQPEQTAAQKQTEQPEQTEAPVQNAAPQVTAIAVDSKYILPKEYSDDEALRITGYIDYDADSEDALRVLLNHMQTDDVTWNFEDGKWHFEIAAEMNFEDARELLLEINTDDGKSRVECSIPVARIELRMDDVQSVHAGTAAEINGEIVSAMEFDTDSVELLIDGAVCTAGYEPSGNGYRFAATYDLDDTRTDPLQVQAKLHLQDETIASDAISIPVVPAEVQLYLTVDNSNGGVLNAANAGKQQICGSVETYGKVNKSDLSVCLNGMEAEANWTETETGFDFDAEQDMDLEGRESVIVQIRGLNGAQSNEVMLPVVSLRLSLDDCVLTEQENTKITGTIGTAGSVDENQIELRIDDQIADADITPNSDGTFAFSMDYTPSATGSITISAAIAGTDISTNPYEIEVLATPIRIDGVFCYQQYIASGTGAVELSGNFNTTGDLKSAAISVSGEQIDGVQWNRTDYGYEFNCVWNAVDLQAGDEAVISIFDADDGRVAPESASIPIVEPDCRVDVSPNAVEAMDSIQRFTLEGDSDYQDLIDGEAVTVTADGEPLELQENEAGEVYFEYPISSDMRGTSLKFEVQIPVKNRGALQKEISVAVEERTLGRIVVVNNKFEWRNGEKSIQIKGQASEKATVNIYANDAKAAAASVNTDDDGRFDVPLKLSDLNLKQGENTIRVAYPDGVLTEDDYSPVEISVFYDDVAPVIHAADRITQDDDVLEIRVEDDTPKCSVEVYKNDQMVDREQIAIDEIYWLDLSDYTLLRGDVFTVIVKDKAGNTSTVDIPFIRSADPILPKYRIDGLYSEETLPVLEGTAAAGETLICELNGTDIPVQVNEKGSFKLDLHDLDIEEGKNTLKIAYTESNPDTMDYSAAEAIEWEFEYDSVGVEFDVEPAQIMQGGTISVTSNEQEDWSASLKMGEKTIVDSTDAKNGEVQLQIAQNVLPNESCELTVVVRDAADNITTKPVAYRYIQPIESVLCSGDDSWWQFDVDYFDLDFTAEPGSIVQMQIANGARTTECTVDADGHGVFYMGGMLEQGFNTITLTYADQNGFDVQCEAEISILYDSIAPEAEIEDTLLTRDTKAIRGTITNDELNGVWVELYIDGKEAEYVWDDAAAFELPLSDETIASLKNASTIELRLEDSCGNITTYPLQYENTSAWADALADISLTGIQSASAGETIPISKGVVFCGEWDMPDCVTFRLVDVSDSSKRYLCDYRKGEMTESEYSQESRNYDLSDYAVCGYYIESIGLPADIPSGEYRLQVDIETDGDEYMNFSEYMDGSIQIESGSASITPYADAGRGYAIGFDEPAQDSFRSDNIVLTGWTCYAAGKIPYYDRIEIVNAYGQKDSIVLADQIFQRRRNDAVQQAMAHCKVPAVAIAESKADDAGFVLVLDLTDNKVVVDGEMLTIRLYSTDDVNDVASIKPTAEIKVTIDNSAGRISQAQIDQLKQDDEEVLPEAGQNN